MADAKGHVRPDDDRLAGCAMAAVGGTVTLHWRIRLYAKSRGDVARGFKKP